MSKLAIHGGAPVTETPPAVLDWPPTTAETADRLRELYLSRQWSFNSPAEVAFEEEFAKYHGARHGIFMANGTVTLEAALHALGVGPGDEVIVPVLTWMATAMAVRYVGAVPVFVDIEPTTLCLDVDKTAAAITDRTKAVIPVHIYGGMADLERLGALAEKRGIAVVEDCAHMQGGFWNGRGAGSWGVVGSFSFQQSKTLSSGEGGICITNDAKLAERLYRFKHIGYSRYDKQGQAGTPPPPDLLCHNYRGTAFQALILSDQLKALPELIGRYGAFADIVTRGIAEVPGVRTQSKGRLAGPQGYYCFCLVFDGPEWAAIPMPRLREAFAKEGCGVYATYGPVYKHLLFNLPPGGYRLAEGGCPVGEGPAMERVALLSHQCMYYPETAKTIVEIVRKLHAHIGDLREG